MLSDAGLELSKATIEQICDEAVQHLQPVYEGIQQRARTRGMVGVDKTGLRLNGDNRWMWAMATPWEVVYRPDERLSHAVAEELLGADFAGTITCDFYCA